MDLKAVDVHSHLNFAAFRDDREAVLARMRSAGVGTITVGAEARTSARAVALAEEAGEGVWAAVGLHPVHTQAARHDPAEDDSVNKSFLSRAEKFDRDFYRDLARSPKVVAIGECGLDTHRAEYQTAASRERQREVFVAQIELALELDKPLMLHVRGAYGEVLSILEGYKREHGERLRGNVHFFAGDLQVAERFFSLGFTLSFTGVLTFTGDYDEVVRRSPLTMILAETDAPYVAPTPHRGRRNEPSYVLEVIKAIARIRTLSEEEITRTLLENARRLFTLR